MFRCKGLEFGSIICFLSSFEFNLIIVCCTIKKDKKTNYLQVPYCSKVANFDPKFYKTNIFPWLKIPLLTKSDKSEFQEKFLIGGLEEVRSKVSHQICSEV